VILHKDSFVKWQDEPKLNRLDFLCGDFFYLYRVSLFLCKTKTFS